VAGGIELWRGGNSQEQKAFYNVRRGERRVRSRTPKAPYHSAEEEKVFVASSSVAGLGSKEAERVEAYLVKTLQSTISNRGASKNARKRVVSIHMVKRMKEN